MDVFTHSILEDCRQDHLGNEAAANGLDVDKPGQKIASAAAFVLQSPIPNSGVPEPSC